MSGGTPRVVIAGGGVAALEGLLALHALAPGMVDPVLLCPDREFVYAPLGVLEPFGLGKAPRFELDPILADLGVERIQGTLAAIDCESGVLETGEGGELSFDAALIAVGAQTDCAVQGALTYRGWRDGEAFGRLLGELERGDVGSAAFVIPAGVAWPLPIYELALMTAGRLASKGVSAELSLITSEQMPLRLFGRKASSKVTTLLARANIELRSSRHVDRFVEGSLKLVPDDDILAERAVAAPRLSGRRVTGLPSDPNGFLRTSGFGLVEQADAVYAAGDVTNFPVKQGGIATQQADTAASVIAARFGAPIEPMPFRPVLRGLMLSEEGPTFVRAEIAGGTGDNEQVSRDPLWSSADKIRGRYLSSYLAERGLIALDAVGA